MKEAFWVPLTRHLDAIERRDLTAYCETVVNDERLTVVLPNGTLIRGFEAVRTFYENWFSDPDWKMTFSVVQETVNQDSALVLLDVTYDDLDAQGKPVTLHYFLSLHFIFEQGEWRLLFDQNTFKPEVSSS